MSETKASEAVTASDPAAPTTAPAAPTPKQKSGGGTQKKKATKHPRTGTAKHAAASHPPYGAMIKGALKSLNDRKGSSRAAIFKYIMQHYNLGGNVAAVCCFPEICTNRPSHRGFFFIQFHLNRLFSVFVFSSFFFYLFYLNFFLYDFI
ncbi:unnamed protein product [Gongylonema pulchrum]|uniref:H15 domain-containing protein n=1 Tax=Gongylonema pulchrum TaxID=637853 RepID=A0A183EG50_9BILA|nr:unnamed protein product [Gongylonema pulchrum]